MDSEFCYDVRTDLLVVVLMNSCLSKFDILTFNLCAGFFLLIKLFNGKAEHFYIIHCLFIRLLWWYLGHRICCCQQDDLFAPRRVKWSCRWKLVHYFLFHFQPWIFVGIKINMLYAYATICFAIISLVTSSNWC